MELYKFDLGKFQEQLDLKLAQLGQDSFCKRFWGRDTSLWTSDAAIQARIKDRLGWLFLPEAAQSKMSELTAFAEEVRKAGFRNILLLGMGGSSLAPEMFASVFGSKEGYPQLYILDSTDPEAIRAVEKKINADRTLFIVSSKSGTTIETLSFFEYFYEKVKSKKGSSAGEQFIAITDPGTSLEKTASRLKFRKIFTTPLDVGGRYSAFTYFGLVPAALIGVDIGELIQNVLATMKEINGEARPEKNAAVLLGASLAELAKMGRDKLTLVMPAKITSLADWIEQLVAESTGKEGKGILPVIQEPKPKGGQYGNDRVFVLFNLGSPESSAQKLLHCTLSKQGHPVISFCLKDLSALGGQLYLWEVATAMAGVLIKIDPFDEPNVAESKDNTNRLLQNSAKGSAFARADETVSIEDKVEVQKVLQSLLRNVKKDDYLAFMIYGQRTGGLIKQFSKIRQIIIDRFGIASTLGFGPRYLHSTGQLHKGGPNRGIFLQLVPASSFDLSIPNKPYSFEVLKQAQSLGDYQSLKSKGRRVVRIGVKGNLVKGVDKLYEYFKNVSKS